MASHENQRGTAVMGRGDIQGINNAGIDVMALCINIPSCAGVHWCVLMTYGLCVGERLAVLPNKYYGFFIVMCRPMRPLAKFAQL